MSESFERMHAHDAGGQQRPEQNHELNEDAIEKAQQDVAARFMGELKRERARYEQRPMLTLKGGHKEVPVDCAADMCAGRAKADRAAAQRVLEQIREVNEQKMKA